MMINPSDGEPEGGEKREEEEWLIFTELFTRQSSVLWALHTLAPTLRGMCAVPPIFR